MGKKRKVAKKRKQSDMPVSLDDLGPIDRWRAKFEAADKGRAERAEVIRREVTLEIRPRSVVEGGRVVASGAFNTAEHSLDWLYKKGYLGDLSDEDQERRARWRVLAGVELHRLFWESKTASSVTVNYETVGSRSSGEMTDDQAEAFAEYKAAIDLCRPNANFIARICVDRAMIRTTDEVALRVLLKHLDRLASHFRIAESNAPRRSRIRGGPI